MGKIVPIILALAGLGAGAGAGFMLRPTAPVETADACADPATLHDTATLTPPPAADSTGQDSVNDFVKMNNQFVIPVVAGGKVSALVVLSLSLEIEVGQSDVFYKREPRLRDTFLQVLFDHANSGGFEGVFTGGTKMTTLRQALREAAQAELGASVIGVLVTDIVRQDV